MALPIFVGFYWQSSLQFQTQWCVVGDDCQDELKFTLSVKLNIGLLNIGLITVPVFLFL